MVTFCPASSGPGPRRRCIALVVLATLIVPTTWLRSAEELVVMTYNLRYASDTPGEVWSERRPLVAECIRRSDPDIVGTQEGLYRQLQDVAADLPHYEWIGLGRQGGSRDEFTAIFYRSARLTPLEFDHFWLSDTPDVIGSMTWGNRYRRMVTWVRFLDAETQQKFEVWNTHFDHEVQAARVKSAALLRERISQVDPAVPVFLIGDFNADAESNDVHDQLVADGTFQDTWLVAAARKGGARGTFNGFGTVPTSGRIDWILFRGPLTVTEAEVVEYAPGGRYPSDHFPVVARVRFGAAAAERPE